MAWASDLDRFDLTASQIAGLAHADVKLVQNLVDRGIMPFRSEPGRAKAKRTFSLASVLTLALIVEMQTVGVSLVDASEIAREFVNYARDVLSGGWHAMRAKGARKVISVAFDRSVNPPAVIFGFSSEGDEIGDLQCTLVSGWPARVTLLIHADELLNDSIAAYDRLKKKLDK